KIGAVDPFHGDVECVAFAPVVEDVDHVGMRNCRRRACFLFEARHEARVPRVVLAQYLYRDLTPERRIRGQVRFGETSLTNSRGEPVTAAQHMRQNEGHTSSFKATPSSHDGDSLRA